MKYPDVEINRRSSSIPGMSKALMQLEEKRAFLLKKKGTETQEETGKRRRTEESLAYHRKMLGMETMEVPEKTKMDPKSKSKKG